MFLYGNNGKIMTDNKTTLQKLDKSNELARQATDMDVHKRLKSATSVNPLPKDTISEALRFALKSQSFTEEVSKISQNLPSVQLQRAMDAAMAPSKAIQAALDAMPSTRFQKAIKQMPTVSMPKMRSLPSAQKIPTPNTLREKQPNFHALSNVAELGVAIRNVRKSKRLTQQSFADLAGVGRRFISELEQGKQTLEVGKVFKVASAAGIQLAFAAADTNS